MEFIFSISWDMKVARPDIYKILFKYDITIPSRHLVSTRSRDNMIFQDHCVFTSKHNNFIEAIEEFKELYLNLKKENISMKGYHIDNLYMSGDFGD